MWHMTGGRRSTFSQNFSSLSLTVLGVRGDMWHLTCHTWHLTPLHVSHDTQGVVDIRLRQTWISKNVKICSCYKVFPKVVIFVGVITRANSGKYQLNILLKVAWQTIFKYLSHINEIGGQETKETFFFILLMYFFKLDLENLKTFIKSHDCFTQGQFSVIYGRGFGRGVLGQTKICNSHRILLIDSVCLANYSHLPLISIKIGYVLRQ